MNINDLLGSFGPHETEEAKRLREVRTKLLDDKAKKEWETILDHINGLVGDVRGKVEAIAFCKVYIKRFVSMSADVAKDCGLPPEIASILAFYLLPMLDFAITDRYQQIAEDDRFMNSLLKQTEGTPNLSDDEVALLQEELETLKPIVALQKETEQDEADDEGVMNVYDDEPNCQKFDPTSELDPKNPFGLN